MSKEDLVNYKCEITYNRFGLFYQMNETNEYLLLYSHSEKERSLDEWIEIFSTNFCFMILGRYSLWTVDKDNNCPHTRGGVPKKIGFI